MKFVPARDLRIRPGSVWKNLKASRRLVITSNGKPQAILKDISGKDLEEEWKNDIIADGLSALSRIRAAARTNGTDALTVEEIDKEIRASRKGR